MSLTKLLTEHTVSVERLDSAIAGGKGGKTKTTVSASLLCRVEELPTRTRGSLLGQVPGAAWVLSWLPGTELRDGDLVTYDGRTYVLRKIQDGTGRRRTRYYTGVLAEKNS